MIMMTKLYSGTLGPKASRNLSYRRGKTPRKPHPGNWSRPGIEPGPATWQARMLPPVPQRCTIFNVNGWFVPRGRISHIAGCENLESWRNHMLPESFLNSGRGSLACWEMMVNPDNWLKVGTFLDKVRKIRTLLFDWLTITDNLWFVM